MVCRKGPAALQRGRRCNAAGLPLRHGGVPVATPRGPHCSEVGRTMGEIGVELSRYLLDFAKTSEIQNVKFLILL